MTRYKCSLIPGDERPQIMVDANGRRLAGYQYIFDFRLVQKDKVGQPDEDRDAKEHRVSLEASIDQLNHLEKTNKQVPDAEARMLYWFARKALERGENSTKLDLGNRDAKIDLSRVDLQPFELDLPGPIMGFHVGR